MAQTRPLPRLPVLAAAASLVILVPTAAQAAPAVRVHVQGPVNTVDPAHTRLAHIDTYGKVPVWQHTYAIPYGTIEAKIRSELNKLTKDPISGKEECDDPCPDVTWSVKVQPTFRFTKKNQPVLTQLGSSGDAKVRAKIDTQVRLDIHADIHAETWSDSEDVSVDLFVVIGAHGSADVKLWPKIEVTNLKLDFTLDDSNIDLDLNGVAIKLGAKYGSLLGGTPLGVMGGGPLALGSLLAVLGDAAADKAEEAIRKEFDKKAETLLEQAHGDVRNMVQAQLDPAISSANDLKKKFLESKLPGVNQSLSSLQSALGMSIQLHTVTPSGGLAASAVLRMNGKPGNARLTGRLEIPKNQCIYATGTGILSGMRMPIGLEPINEHLDKAVGKSCAQIVPSTAVKRALYLGGNPRVALGVAAKSLPVWKSSPGNFSFEGSMTHNDDVYACEFELTSLPDAAIVQLETGAAAGRSLELKPDQTRWMVMRAGPTTLIFDDELKPKPRSVVGGPGTCSGGGRTPALTPSKAKELVDWIDNCPECGKRLQKGGEVIYEIRDPEAFAKTTVGAEVMQSLGKASGRARTRSRAGAKIAPGSKAVPRTKALPRAGH